MSAHASTDCRLLTPTSATEPRSGASTGTPRWNGKDGNTVPVPVPDWIHSAGPAKKTKGAQVGVIRLAVMPSNRERNRSRSVPKYTMYFTSAPRVNSPFPAATVPTSASLPLILHRHASPYESWATVPSSTLRYLPARPQDMASSLSAAERRTARGDKPGTRPRPSMLTVPLPVSIHEASSGVHAHPIFSVRMLLLADDDAGLTSPNRRYAQMTHAASKTHGTSSGVLPVSDLSTIAHQQDLLEWEPSSEGEQQGAVRKHVPARHGVFFHPLSNRILRFRCVDDQAPSSDFDSIKDSDFCKHHLGVVRERRT